MSEVKVGGMAAVSPPMWVDTNLLSDDAISLPSLPRWYDKKFGGSVKGAKPSSVIHGAISTMGPLLPTDHWVLPRDGDGEGEG